MIEIIKDADENILAVCDYLVLNRKKELDVEGEVVVILHAEVSKTARGNGLLVRMIKEILIRHPKAEECFFTRETKYPGRKVKRYVRQQFERIVGG
jgi:sugar/nucleoside kinase (ribokinase family)